MTRLAETLNRGCHCITADLERLREGIDGVGETDGLLEEMQARQPNLFSASALFLDPETIEQVRETIDAVEAVVATPAFVEAALAGAPETARRDPGPRGVFFGYDFHLGPDGPQLIEVNTNAGGALLNLYLARAQQACCREVHQVVRGVVPLDGLEEAWVEMFRQEWRLQRGDAPLRRIAIVDADPEAQFMYPEFRLFVRLFRAQGIDAVIAAPDALELRDGALRAGGLPIDLVYARLCDFGLEEPGSTVLRTAWEQDRVVLTPHPRSHALYAHKQNLVTLSDPAVLRALGVPDPVVRTLGERVPGTIRVEDADPETLWAERRQWFFKPGAGYGSRAAYRGDKLTRSRWQELLRTGG